MNKIYLTGIVIVIAVILAYAGMISLTGFFIAESDLEAPNITSEEFANQATENISENLEGIESSLRDLEESLP